MHGSVGTPSAVGREPHDYLKSVAPVILELEPAHRLATCHLGEVVLLVETVPEAMIRQWCKVVVAILLDAFVELDIIIQLAAAVPAAGHAPTADAVRTLHPAFCPKHLAVVVVDAVVEVEDDFLRCTLGKYIAVHTTALCGGEFAADVVVVEGDGIVARRGHLGFVAETLAVAPVGIVGGAGVELRLAAIGHDENVAQVAVACAAEMGVAEAHDAAVAVLIAGTVVIDTRLINPVDVVGNGVGVGTQLHKAVGETGTGKGVPHTVGADKNIDMLRCTDAILCRSVAGKNCCRHSKAEA